MEIGDLGKEELYVKAVMAINVTFKRAVSLSLSFLFGRAHFVGMN